MSLKILVTAKRVEDPESKIRVKPDGSGIVTDGVNYKLNPFDEIAVEEALRLKESTGARWWWSRSGPKGRRPRSAPPWPWAPTAPSWCGTTAPLDPVVVSELLAKVVEAEKPDLVLLGKQSIDDDQNQTGQYLAERLGWPQATFASKTESLESEAEQKSEPGMVLSADGKALTVVREVDGGVETAGGGAARRWSPPTSGSTSRASPRCPAS